jgi:CheY-like chemotaxis protein
MRSPRGPVLVADNAKGVLAIFVDALQGEGFEEVVTVEDGAQAVAKFSTDPTKWDLVIVKFVMPKLSGPDVLRVVRASNPKLPVYLTSADPHDAHVAAESHATGFIEKRDPDFIRQELRRCLRAL